MKPILRACLSARDSRGFTLDCGDEAAMRIVALADDLVRVTALRGGEVRQKRTWAVPAYGREDTDWSGRARLDDSSWPAVATEITASPAKVAMATGALRLSVSLDGFRMDWALPDGTIFARDRDMQPYFLGQKTHAFKHAMARAPGDRHYGLGDKTGPLDLTGRRLRCAMRDSLGFDPERGDPLYKNWPFLIVRDAASGVSHGVFYDNAAEGAFDFGCEHDNYFGRYRAYEAEDGDLDFYLILGPRLANVTAKFVALTGRRRREVLSESRMQETCLSGSMGGCGNGATAEPLRHRQTKGAANGHAQPKATAPHSYSTHSGRRSGSKGGHLQK